MCKWGPESLWQYDWGCRSLPDGQVGVSLAGPGVDGRRGPGQDTHHRPGDRAAWVQAHADVEVCVRGRFIWQHLTLPRMSPFVPFAVSNYTFGLMAVSLATYALACVGIIPLTIIEVVVGANVSGISNLFTGNTIDMARCWFWSH